MKPFVFRLETLLEIRKRREEQANIVLSQARKKLFDAQAVLAQLVNKQKESWAEFREKQASGQIVVLEFQAWYQFLAFLEKAIKQQEEVIEALKQEVAAALKKVEQAMKERKAVEKLKEKRFEQYMFELQQEEQKVLDEIAITRYKRQEGDEF